MATVLDSIIEGVREDLATRMAAVSENQLLEAVAARAAAIPAAEILLARDFSIISEVKRSSPSKGHLAAIADPAKLATAYAAGGASVISVLTEQRRFSGSLADLDAVRAAVDIPILRKDFMVEPYQVLEARAHGADVILLIVAGLSDAQMQELNQFALELGMSVLVEIHDEAELERALRISPKLLGINARNLKTLEVDLATCHRLLPKLPVDVVAVAESGISQLHEVQELATSGARAILVGEALVTGGTPTESVREWLLAGTLSRAQAKEIESL